MSSDTVEMVDVWKRFQKGSLQTIVTKLLNRQSMDDFWAVREINFSISPGESLGIIGPNGAGKSTLLKILAGIMFADRGLVKVPGRISSIIELGAGFQSELTGRENLYFVGALYGLRKHEITAVFDSIIEFAGISDFIDVPVKKYSSGMLVRLGFSLLIHTNPQLMLVDEALSVGDESFQRKSFNKFVELKRSGCSVILVSHDLGLISNSCDKVILMNGGRIVEYGNQDKCISRYFNLVGGDIDGVSLLQNQDIHVIFSNGKISIYKNGYELTTKWGLYTSILLARNNCDDAIWVDSTRASWVCRSSGENQITCIGEYISQPLVQYVMLRLQGNRLFVEIDLKLAESIYFERCQTNVMLRRDYHNWHVGEAAGEFPLDFTSRDYHNWDILGHANEKTMRCLSAEDKWAQVTFTSCQQKDLIAAIVNSSQFFSGRVMMFLDMDSRYLPPGTYNYFHGYVDIGC